MKYKAPNSVMRLAAGSRTIYRVEMLDTRTEKKFGETRASADCETLAEAKAEAAKMQDMIDPKEYIRITEVDQWLDDDEFGIPELQEKESDYYDQDATDGTWTKYDT